MSSNTPWGVPPPSQSWSQQSQGDHSRGPYTVPPPGLPPGQPPGHSSGLPLGPPPPHSWSDSYSQNVSKPPPLPVASQHYITPTGPPQSQFSGPPPPHGLPSGPPPSHPTSGSTFGPKLGLPTGPPPGPPPVPLQSAPSGITPIHGHSYISQGPPSVPPLGSPPSEPPPPRAGPQSYSAQSHFSQTSQCNGSSYQGIESSAHEAAVLEFLSKGRVPSNRQSQSPQRDINSHRLDREKRSRESCERSISVKSGYRDGDNRDSSKMDRSREGRNIIGTKRNDNRNQRNVGSNMDEYTERNSRRGSLDRSPDKSPQGSRLLGGRGRKIVRRKRPLSKDRQELASVRENDEGIRRNGAQSTDFPLKVQQRTAIKKTKDSPVKRNRLLGNRGGRGVVGRKRFSPKERRELAPVREDVEGNRRNGSLPADFSVKENQRTTINKSKDLLVKRERGEAVCPRVKPHEHSLPHKVRRESNDRESINNTLTQNKRSTSPVYRRSRELTRNSPHRSPIRSPVRQSPAPSPVRSAVPSPVRSPVQLNPVQQSPVRQIPARQSPVRSSVRQSSTRSPVRRNPGRQSPIRNSVRKSPIRRNPVRQSPVRRNPVRSPTQRNPVRQNSVGQNPHRHSSTSREDSHKQSISNTSTNFNKEKLKDGSPKFKVLDETVESSEHEYEEVKSTWLKSSPAELFYEKHKKYSHITCATDMLKNLCHSMDEKMVQRGKKMREEKIKQREQVKIEKEKNLKTKANDAGSVINPKESKTNNKSSCAQEHSSCAKKNNSCDTDTVSSIAGSAVSSIAESAEVIKKNNEKSTSRESSPSIPQIEKNLNIHQSGDSSETSVKPKIKESRNEETCEKKFAEGSNVKEMAEPGEIVSEPENTVKTIPSCKKKHDHHHNHSHKKKRKRRKKKENNSESSNSSSDSDSSDSDSLRSISSSSSSCDSEEEDDIQAKRMKELERRRNHPDRLHEELWFNDPGEMNDGPLCRCSLKAQRSGIRHGFYLGEEKLEPCDPWSNNADRLYHYLVTLSPPTNFLVKIPTVISYVGNEFIFEGFSLLSHHPLKEVPTCSVIRFNIEYTILYIEEKIPDNFCVKELDLFYDYLFLELLELVDLNFNTMGATGGCPRFHFLPRFVRDLPDNGKEILAMNEVLMHILRNNGPLIPEEELSHLLNLSQYQWQNYADNLKGMVVTCPGMKPCSIRVDQLDRDQDDEEVINYPVIVHFGIRPPQLSYAGNPVYQKAWREYVKFRHLLANMPKPSPEDKRKLANKESHLQEMRMTSKMKRDVTVAVSSHGFYRTGIMCDVIQHAMLLPVLICHLRFHQSLDVLTDRIGYKFRNRYLLQLALTHPSYRENFGTNPDHARNSLTNCSIRQPEYGDRRIHYMHTRKRGINTLINIMSRFGARQETESKITHNERLEFLGDAVVEFLSSIHLFHLFPNLEEGGLATYRAAIVQNQHLAVLAEKLGLDEFMLYAHGSDLCHDFELRHAMANCFEALMGAIFLDAGIEEADKVFSATLFLGEELQHDIWVNYPPHPLQEQEPNGDRKWMEHFPILRKLSNFEGSIGVEFRHIRLLARVFTDRSIGPNNLTLGSNQRLEFLGDTVLQLVASEYLYKFFPEHHEGHLSLLRSSLVNNRTQAVVCDDLGMTKYAIYSELKSELKTKDRADLLEAFLGALYIDRGLDFCQLFCDVCFFPRLHQFIMNQDWNDPKSKLQQCCLTLRTMDGGEPDIPIYKVIECKGPTNTRVYTVAVYFRNKRLAKASGHSIQTAEMNAAKEALCNSKDLFPQLDHQRRVIEKSVKVQVGFNARVHSRLGDTQKDNDLIRREQDKGRERIKEKVRREGDVSDRPEYSQDEERKNRHSSKSRNLEQISNIHRDSRSKMKDSIKSENDISEKNNFQDEEQKNGHCSNSKYLETRSDLNRDSKNRIKDKDKNDSDLCEREEYPHNEERINKQSGPFKFSETRHDVHRDSRSKLWDNDKNYSDISERAENVRDGGIQNRHRSNCKYSETRGDTNRDSKNKVRDNNKSNSEIFERAEYFDDGERKARHCSNSKNLETKSDIHRESQNSIRNNDKSGGDLFEREKYLENEERMNSQSSNFKYSDAISDVHRDSRNSMRDNDKKDRFESGNEKLEQNSRYIGGFKYRNERLNINENLRKEDRLKSNQISRFGNRDKSSLNNDKSRISSLHEDKYLDENSSKHSKHSDKSNRIIPDVKEQSRNSNVHMLYLRSEQNVNGTLNKYTGGKALRKNKDLEYRN